MAPLAPGRRVSESAAASDLVDVELVRVRVPLVEPLTSAHGREDVRDVILVRVALADGTEGWGECSALSRPTMKGRSPISSTCRDANAARAAAHCSCAIHCT